MMNHNERRLAQARAAKRQDRRNRRAKTRHAARRAAVADSRA